MIRRIFFSGIIHIAMFLVANGQSDQMYTRTLILMGSRFDITASHKNPQVAWTAIENGIAEIQRIEHLISSWDSSSQTSQINRMAGIAPTPVDPELYQLIARSLKVSQLTEGAFDISFASMDRIWDFDGTKRKMPEANIVKTAATHIDYQKIELDRTEGTVFLREAGMKIGFGAIGKGYAANRAKLVMKESGIEHGLVNAAGDLLAWGHMPDGASWKIGIADPVEPKEILGWLLVENGSVVTSGDYERFAIIDGKRYAHIIDPRTGYPTTGSKSVTIVCPDAELGDALATSVFVLGPRKGLELINQLSGIECLIVSDDNDILTSHNLDLQPHLPESPGTK